MSYHLLSCTCLFLVYKFMLQLLECIAQKQKLKKRMKLCKATMLVLVTIVLFASFLHPSMALANVTAAVPNSGCWPKCKGRCSNTELEGRCMKYCSICCQKCNCVPSGTFGNKHECPCYRDMVSSKGTPKCP